MLSELTPEKIKKLELREDMLLKRHKLTQEQMRPAMIKASEDIMDIINRMRRVNCVGLYGAINKEMDMRFLAEMLLSKGIKVALPRVVSKGQPLVFNQWDMGPLHDKDAEGIPCAMGLELKPDVVVVPVVAFNEQGYRLGYGSGYYDLTFSKVLPDAYRIGIGYSFQKSDEVVGEDHDIPMHVVVTDKEIIHVK